MASPEVSISARAIVHNMRVLQNVSNGLPLFPVLKADAYGHGALLVAMILEQNFNAFEIPYFCLARVREAAELRLAGVRRPLLVLSHFGREDLEGLPRDVELALHSFEDIALLQALPPALLRQIGGIHLNINTGMNRLGFRLTAPEDWDEFMSAVGVLTGRGLRVKGLMTHLARGEEDPALLSQRQVAAFELGLGQVRERWDTALHGAFPDWIHVSNSAGLVRRLGTPGLITAGRPGLHLWGAFQTFEEAAEAGRLGLRPAMRVRAPVRQVFRVPAGEGIGYGHKFICPRDTLVGTVCLGYADGLDRRLSRAAGDEWRTGFVVEGVRVPIIGTVSMDLTMIDLTDHPSAALFAEDPPRELWATWIGDGQSVEELALDLKTLSYEIFCALGHRLPRRESDA